MKKLFWFILVPLFFFAGVASAKEDFDPLVLSFYEEFKAADKATINLKEFRPKEESGWDCEVSSAFPGEPISFKAKVVTDTAFGGRSLRFSVRGVERKDVNVSGKVSLAKAEKSGTTRLIGYGPREIVGEATRDQAFGGKWYVHRYKSVRSSYFCFARVKDSGELMIEVSSDYDLVPVDSEELTLYADSETLRLNQAQRELRFSSKPSQCLQGTLVEYYLICQ